MNVDELPDLAGPDGVLGVADLGVFNVDEPCDPGAEVVLRAPAGELDFLLEGPALWSGAWREPSDVRDHWGTDEPRPPAVTVSIPLIE